MKASVGGRPWKETASLPKQDDLLNVLTSLPSKDTIIFREAIRRRSVRGPLRPPTPGPIGARFSIDRPARLRNRSTTDDGLNPRGIYPDRAAIAEEMLRGPQRSRLTQVEGSGCYGHNGAECRRRRGPDRARVAGMPVRVQWMREQEQGWEASEACDRGPD